MSSSRRPVLAAVIAAATIAAGAMTRTGHGQAQQQDPPPQTPTFRTGINFVRVDVIVTDKSGNPVDDLKPEDFEVTEAGKPQKIETFKVVTLDGGLMATGDEAPRAIRSDADEEREAARDDVRLFAVFLDDYHRGSPPGS